jgi:Retroviral aspartyl protease
LSYTIQLRISTDPGVAEIFCNLLRKDGNQEKITAVIDTGAEISLFPLELFPLLQTKEQEEIEVEQAGIAKQSFGAVSTRIQIAFEDATGNLTPLFEIPVWFANTDARIIGFAGVLDRSILHIDMLQQSGWLEIDV